ncbi:MAG: hypothetical protein DRP09_20300 [Candidatus Thorarchaeota archaeon]|nr:MAG: hypothetical protein DRP09_20300 [Candidatus Thorarchaeota archaeon]
MKAQIDDKKESKDGALIDPDPVSIFLSILGTLGGLASIIAYIEYKMGQRVQMREQEEKTRRELSDLFMALEVENIELMGLLKGLEVILLKGTDHTIPLNQLPFEFGGIRPLFTYQGYRKFDETLLTINRKCGKMIELTSQILQRLYYYSLRIDKSLMENLIKFRDQLNIVLHASMSYDEAFRRYEEIIHQAQLLSRELRESLKRQ